MGVEVGALHFHHGAIGAHGRTLVAIAPVLIANFKVDGTGKGFGSYGINLGTQTLPGKEYIVGIGMMAVVLVDKAAVAGGHAEQPLAGGFEVNGGSAGRRAEHHGGSQGERHDTFHGKKSFRGSYEKTPTVTAANIRSPLTTDGGTIGQAKIFVKFFEPG